MDPTWFVVVRPTEGLAEGTLFRVSPSEPTPVERIGGGRWEATEHSLGDLQRLVQAGFLLAITDAEAQLLMAPPPQGATGA